MLGAVLDRPGRRRSSSAASRDGLLINCTADRVLRFLPPLVDPATAQVDEGFAILERALAAHEARPPPHPRPRPRRDRGDPRARRAAQGEAARRHGRIRCSPGRTLAMIFEKPSLRTRVTFEVGMVQLGGAAIHLAPGDIRLGERESAGDIARNLERWVDLVMARVVPRTRASSTSPRRARAGHQRPLRPPPSLPGALRLLHAARAPRQARRAPRRLRRRRQQHGALVDGRRRAASASTSSSPARPATSPIRRSSPRPGRASSVTHDAARGRARRRRRLHRRVDEHGAGGRGRGAAHVRSGRTR